MIKVTLPLPPTTNNLFFNLKGRGGRAKSQAYKQWLKDAQPLILAAYREAGSPVFADKQRMALHLRVGVGYRSDIENRCKAVADALCAFLPIPDDRYTDRVVIERDLDCEGFVVVTLMGIDAARDAV